MRPRCGRSGCGSPGTFFYYFPDVHPASTFWSRCRAHRARDEQWIGHEVPLREWLGLRAATGVLRS